MIDPNTKFPIPFDRTWNIIDSTKLNAYIECPRKFFYEYMLGWRSTAPNNDIRFGGAWHIAMEHLLLNGYNAKSIGDAFDKFTTYYREEFLEVTDPLYDPKIPSRALLALVEYTKKYPADLAEYKVLYTEIAGTVPVTPDWIMHFRMDSIWKDKNEMYGSWEHKTHKKSFAANYLNNWLLNISIGTYHHVLYCLYEENQVKGVVLNGAGILKTKFDFQRFPLRRSKEQMQVWMDTVLFYLDSYANEVDVLEGESLNRRTMLAFPLSPTSCGNYWGCPYIDFCMAWPNPLQKCDEPPMGFEVNFWDPNEMPSTHRMDLGKKEE